MIRLLAALLLAACGSGFFGPSDQRALDEARNRWDSSGITSYTFDYRHDCFCADGGRLVRIQVESDLVVSVEPADSQGPLAAQNLSAWPTIDTLFSHIASLSNSDSFDGYKFQATYDAVIGYPVSIQLVAPSNVADAGSTEQVSNFEPLDLEGRRSTVDHFLHSVYTPFPTQEPRHG
jgi:hypothetical protein